MIEVQGLTKRYGPVSAVRDVSFRVEKGDIVGFLGPNGAGKTTTMRILTGFLPATDGTASVAGFDVQKEPLEVKKRIGYLPETPPVYTDMSVTEYLEFVARIKGLRGAEIKERVEYVMERVSIGPMKDRLNGKLSKGYRQRVGIAQALIHDPDVLILDEPTSGLDPAQIIEVRDLIQELAQDHTVILSTHILSEVESVCSRAIIIAEGEIKANDTLEELVASQREHGTLEVKVGGPVAEVATALGDLDGVESVELPPSPNGVNLFSVRAEKGAEPQAQLARTVVENGWDLHELTTVELSLEDVFLKLTAPKEEVVTLVEEEPVVVEEEEDEEDDLDRHASSSSGDGSSEGSSSSSSSSEDGGDE